MDTQRNRLNEGSSPPPIPAFSMRGVLSPLVLVPILLTVLITLFAPEDVLTRYPLAEKFTYSVRSTLLSISKYTDIANHANSTRYPQVALLVNSLLWIFWIWNSLIYCVQGFVNYDILVRRRIPLGPFPRKEIKAVCLGGLLLISGIAGLTILPGDPSFMRGITTHNRVGYAFLGLGILLGASTMLGFLPTWIRLVIEMNFKRGKE